MYPNRVALLALIFALACAVPAAAQDPAATPTATPAPAATAPEPAIGVDVADYGSAFDYWQVGGLDPKTCPYGPIGHYDEARIQSFTVPVTDSAGAVVQVHPIAFTLPGGHPCEWWYGDDYLAMDACNRRKIITHELGHLFGRPDGPGAEGDTLGVMNLAQLCPVAAPAPVDPALAKLQALAARWARYDVAVADRHRAIARRDRCERKLRRAAKTARAARRARPRCLGAVAVALMPAKPTTARPFPVR